MYFLHPYSQSCKVGLPVFKKYSQQRKEVGKERVPQGCGQIKGKIIILKILFKDLEQLSYTDSLNAGLSKVSVSSQPPRVGTGVSNWIKVFYTFKINL